MSDFVIALLVFIRFAKTEACFPFNSIFLEMSNHEHLSRNRQKKKKELFLIISQHLYFNLLNGICFPLYA